ESAVRRVWELFAAKKIDQWQSFYADIASVFGTASKRPEPARLVVLRRQREYLTSTTRVQVHVEKSGCGIDRPGLRRCSLHHATRRRADYQSFRRWTEGAGRASGKCACHPRFPAHQRRQPAHCARAHFRGDNLKLTTC